MDIPNIFKLSFSDIYSHLTIIFSNLHIKYLKKTLVKNTKDNTILEIQYFTILQTVNHSTRRRLLKLAIWNYKFYGLCWAALNTRMKSACPAP